VTVLYLSVRSYSLQVWLTNCAHFKIFILAAVYWPSTPWVNFQGQQLEVDIILMSFLPSVCTHDVCFHLHYICLNVSSDQRGADLLSVPFTNAVSILYRHLPFLLSQLCYYIGVSEIIGSFVDQYNAFASCEFISSIDPLDTCLALTEFFRHHYVLHT